MRPTMTCIARTSATSVAPSATEDNAIGKTVTFDHPFTLPGMDHPHPAGTFIVNEDRETLDVPWSAYRVTLTITLPTAGGHESWPISTGDLELLVANDKSGQADLKGSTITPAVRD